MPDHAALRALPSVDQLLRTTALAAACERFGHAATAMAVRRTLDDARDAIRAGQPAPLPEGLIAQALLALEAADRSNLRPLFNLTGTVLHTNLGRALLAEAAIEAATAAMREAAALELDLDTGRRGERDDHLRVLLCELTGAEDATLVNNNAAAVLIALNALGAGREAIVSRGELIEIGGAFRMPDIMQRAGVRLVEVGTTNRTHPKDYRAALRPETGLILKVHPSNYRIEGFTAEVENRDLAALAHEGGVPLLNDLGSGTLVDLSRWGLKREPTVRDTVLEGADLVTFSGDKLLGGPQAGFIVGRKDLVAAVNRNPLKRALRVDKIRIAALVATLKLYRDPERLAERLPTLRLLARKQPEILALSQRLAAPVAEALGSRATVEVCACRSQIGSGALPIDTLPSAGLRLAAGGGTALARLAADLRALPRPVLGHIADDALVLDLRCLEDEAGLLASLRALPR
ncbi:L-seryl-tRNA(Sec) selenium transferase [Lichenihabitans sp. Uapishka_5]|uniref:L-seryl-tRNA(Sec) selenium transferase n=1 Tax=Lichenihabitans sp. Uapishka_5 TaxID=3037302 RepID=UPI0029E80953|nr:L-seryl-tRNA(Sec) selenium transferase [Lichenihabitans sp. Uapishka_5]MDX7951519.1 L-seryl-tRNA(Sec) selenium transferase [Lichenihabitans sp. Uapishka_5]